MELFDTHCHLTDAVFDEDREAVLEAMRRQGVTGYAVIGYDMESSLRAAAFAAAHEGAVCAGGIHPEHAADYAEHMQELEALARSGKLQAIGEIGLDYHWKENPSPDVQKAAVLEQMKLAHELSLPVCFHVRDAHQDMLGLLRENRGLLGRGIMHCFSGSWETAREYLKLGLMISLAGPLTFRHAPRLEEVALRVPADRLLVETDSPYMAPEPVRGTRNTPSNVRYVLEKAAQIRGVDAEELAEVTTENARSLYGVQ